MLSTSVVGRSESARCRRRKRGIVTSWARKGIEIGIAQVYAQSVEQRRLEGYAQGRLEGWREGLLIALTARFGVAGKKLARRIGKIESTEELRALARRAVRAKTISELGI